MIGERAWWAGMTTGMAFVLVGQLAGGRVSTWALGVALAVAVFWWRRSEQ